MLNEAVLQVGSLRTCRPIKGCFQIEGTQTLETLNGVRTTWKQVGYVELGYTLSKGAETKTAMQCGVLANANHGVGRTGRLQPDLLEETTKCKTHVTRRCLSRAHAVQE